MKWVLIYFYFEDFLSSLNHQEQSFNMENKEDTSMRKLTSDHEFGLLFWNFYYIGRCKDFSVEYLKHGKTCQIELWFN